MLPGDRHDPFLHLACTSDTYDNTRNSPVPETLTGREGKR
jgi:hypothetical protein